MDIEILRGEIERLFSLDELTALSRDLLGLDPDEVGGTNAKASFTARAHRPLLRARCAGRPGRSGDRLAIGCRSAAPRHEPTTASASTRRSRAVDWSDRSW